MFLASTMVKLANTSDQVSLHNQENTVNRSSLSKCLDDYKNFIVS